MNLASTFAVYERIEAGGPGSGRHAGGGKDVKQQDIHRVLSNAGFSKLSGRQFKSYGKNVDAGGNVYQHPKGHAVTVSDSGRWFATSKKW